MGNFVGHASWTGSDPNAILEFNVAKTQPPYSLEHLNLIGEYHFLGTKNVITRLDALPLRPLDEALSQLSLPL